MARQYVFLVHGMGLHAADTWADSFKTTIHAALQNYAPFKGKSADEIEAELVQFEPISYDSVFEGYRQRWKTLSGAIGSSEALANNDLASAFQAIADSAAGNSAVEAFLWQNVLDPILWRGLRQARTAVIARVNKQIGQKLALMNLDVPGSRAHVIAHSLGTSVMHDALVSLRYYQGDEDLFKPNSLKWETVSMVANVGRLLESPWDLGEFAPAQKFEVYRSGLKPGLASSICVNFFNFHHKVDPFTWPRRFAPGDWPAFAYSDIETRRYDDLKRVHDFELYFSDPNVHIPVIRAVFRNIKYCTPKETADAWRTFKDAHTHDATTELDELNDVFGRNSDNKLDLAKLATYLVRVYERLGL